MTNPFRHLNAIGHILPALSIYAWGLFQLLDCYNLLPPFLKRGTSNSKQEGTLFSWVSIGVGTVYALIHFSIVLSADSDKEHMDNITHMNVGVSIALGGVLNWFLTRPGFSEHTINLGPTFSLYGVATVLYFHNNHEHEDGSQDQQGNMIHAVFGLAIFLSGTFMAVRAKFPRWAVLESMSLLASGALLASSSDFVMESVAKNAFGVGNLVMLCVYFSVSHVLAVFLFLHVTGRSQMVQKR
mmetsp:Transcript_4918/g.7434  ORF Transcript_4918/g.7434 Transcript_4918/m.7434 type:complete len:241 (-) Transcript_4918:189-911(-)